MSTSIDDLLKGASGGTDMSEVDSILQELESKSQQQQQPPKQIQAPPQQVHSQSQPDPQIIAQLQAQQQQLQQLSMMNREKDLVIQKMQNNSGSSKNLDNSVEKSVDLLIEFKPTIILFSLVLILTLPVLNKFICKSIGIEENTIFSILRTFIIAIIFFLINKFV